MGPNTSSSQSFPEREDFRKRLEAKRQLRDQLEQSLARDKQRITNLRTRLRDKKNFSDQEFQQITDEAERELQQSIDDFKRDYRAGMKEAPIITALATFTTAATIVAPVDLLCWWMEWWPFRGDKGQEADKALSRAMLQAWSDGKVEKDA